MFVIEKFRKMWEPDWTSAKLTYIVRKITRPDQRTLGFPSLEIAILKNTSGGFVQWSF